MYAPIGAFFGVFTANRVSSALPLLKAAKSEARMAANMIKSSIVMLIILIIYFHHLAGSILSNNFRVRCMFGNKIINAFKDSEIASHVNTLHCSFLSSRGIAVLSLSKCSFPCSGFESFLVKLMLTLL